MHAYIRTSYKQTDMQEIQTYFGFNAIFASTKVTTPFRPEPYGGLSSSSSQQLKRPATCGELIQFTFKIKQITICFTFHFIYTLTTPIHVLTTFEHKESLLPVLYHVPLLCQPPNFYVWGFHFCLIAVMLCCDATYAN